MRGRPPLRSRDVTERQLEVARLIAAGKTNPEIADELGISLDGAKYHVSELLTRLGLVRREEIATWYVHARHEERSIRRRLSAAVGLPLVAVAGGSTAAVVGVAAIFVAFIALADDGEEHAAVLAAISDPPVHVESLEATWRTTSYQIGGDRQGALLWEWEFNLWFEAPDRQRRESWYVPRSLDGETGPAQHSIHLWTGVDEWQYRPEYGEAWHLRAGPGAPPPHPGASGRTYAPFDTEGLMERQCRLIDRTGTDEVGGRAAHVVHLSRPHCGLHLPGQDGPVVFWIDQETGLLLRSESFAVGGQLSHASEIERFELNGGIDPDRFVLELPADVELNDFRDQPPRHAVDVPPPSRITLEALADEATFEVRVPTSIPLGFEIETVEHHWPFEQAREHRSAADRMLIRYVDADGNWLYYTQGYGEFIRSIAIHVPDDAPQGTVEIDGRQVTWFRGSPTTQWEPETMAGLWNVTGTLSWGLASNVLTVDELIEIAESLVPLSALSHR